MTSTSYYPILKFNVRNWTYNIIPRTGIPAANMETFGNTFNLNALPDSSLLIFKNLSMLPCVMNTPGAVKVCGVPDEVPFTIIQKLPSFPGVYDSTWTTNVFNLKGASSNTAFEQAAYVFSGTLTFNRTQVRINRKNFGSYVELEQTSPLNSTYENQEETWYQSVKLAVLVQMHSQFNSIESPDAYKWGQLRDFVIRSLGNDTLLPEYKNYSTTQFVNEFISRMTTVVQFWANYESSKQPHFNFSVTTGSPVDHVLVGYPLIIGFFLLLAWIFLVALSFSGAYIYNYKRRKTTKNLEMKGANLETYLKNICDHPYGLITLLMKTRGEDVNGTRMRISVKGGVLVMDEETMSVNVNKPELISNGTDKKASQRNTPRGSFPNTNQNWKVYPTDDPISKTLVTGNLGKKEETKSPIKEEIEPNW